MKNITKLIISLLVLLTSCKQLPPYKGKLDLIGTWCCNAIEITTPSHNNVNFAMQRYGFASFSLDKDSSYSFSMAILRDVVLEKEAFGNTYSKTIIQAGYKKFRSGFYYATDGNITFLDANKNKVNEESYFFNERTLLTKFIDNDNKLWKISWEKETEVQ